VKFSLLDILLLSYSVVNIQILRPRHILRSQNNIKNAVQAYVRKSYLCNIDAWLQFFCKNRV